VATDFNPLGFDESTEFIGAVYVRGRSVKVVEDISDLRVGGEEP
jgi:hypothetical protein